jgi:hypothetical protein
MSLDATAILAAKLYIRTLHFQINVHACTRS